MNGYCWIIGSCVACGRTIQFNPNRVPSIRVGGVGEKEPLCRSCFNQWNTIHRTSKGLEPIALDPQAYEPESEASL
jgi:hypothetical protein